MLSDDAIYGLDSTDAAIIGILQGDGRESFANIGKAVGLSPTSVGDRVRRLEHGGVIEGYHAAVSLAKLGFRLSAFILARPSGSDAPFAKRAGELPEILNCFRVTGEVDFVLRAVMSDMAHLERILNHLEPVARSVQTLMVLSPAFQRLPQIVPRAAP
jgi:Lrp/AsnC family transcriptional regulator, leucine-responsive regulatory protein